jgi:superoxide dismutase, Cu-Zn family
MNLSLRSMILVGAGVGLSACSTLSHKPVHATAVATLEARSGSQVSGTIGFVQMGDGTVRAHVELSGLSPGSEHGLHIHAVGDCSAADASSAGGHYNPDGSTHGRAGFGAHHAGDIDSVVADGSGRVIADLRMEGVTVEDGARSLVGHSVIVHRDRDDYVSQPSGNAGPRIACGVIVRR